MNRLKSIDVAPQSPAPPHDVQQGILRVEERPASAQARFLPLHYEANYAYPLLVWLHGPCDDERQLQRIMPMVSLRNYVAAAPRGASRGERGYTWPETPGAMAKAEQSVFATIDQVRRELNIAPERIFLGGYDCGGTLALRMALNHPRRFAGAMSLGGPFPTGDNPLGHLAAARKLPLLICRGQNARRYPTEQSCEELRLFHAAGLCVTLRQYPCADELDTHMLSDMDRWMMEIVTGAHLLDGEVSSCDRGD